jgi:hypothetical protein
MDVLAQALSVPGGRCGPAGGPDWICGTVVIGDTVTYAGQAYIVVGFTPMAVTPAQVELRPGRGGESFWVDRVLVTELLAPERAALRRLPRKRHDD